MSSTADDDPIFGLGALEYHLDLLGSDVLGQKFDDALVAPILSSSVLKYDGNSTNQDTKQEIPQIGLLAGVTHILESIKLEQGPDTQSLQDPRLLFNVSSPSSTFICGSQGSGKSHTLSCMLENCLIPSKAGRLPHPLTGLVFHYDSFISDSTGSPCEAAFLSSHPGVDVRILCAPTNIHSIRGTYSRFNIRVDSLQIDQKNLNTKRMMDLMAVGQGEGSIPLYMHTVKRILREMRLLQQATSAGFDYPEFKRKVLDAGLTPGQLEPLKQRLDTLESFMPQSQVHVPQNTKRTSQAGSGWESIPGRLTIVDLSCPCISPETACSLFNVCLSIFLEQDVDIGRVVALDEAHKYMDASDEAQAFTNTLVSVVRLQRHLATRVIVSTQEPTISPVLLNLCSITIVHRFTSPEWLRVLQQHLAGASDSPFSSKKSKNVVTEGRSTEDEETETNPISLFNKIVHLQVGEALIFSPSAIVGERMGDDGMRYERLGANHLKIKIRSRLTLDGGKSVIAL